MSRTIIFNAPKPGSSRKRAFVLRALLLGTGLTALVAFASNTPWLRKEFSDHEYRKHASPSELSIPVVAEANDRKNAAVPSPSLQEIVKNEGKKLSCGTSSNERTVENPDVRALFPGGREAIQQYIASNLRYPAEARETGIEGKVYVEFTIETDGAVTEAHVIRGVNQYLDEEAVRLVREMPRWIPAREKNRAARTNVRLPILFSL